MAKKNHESDVSFIRELAVLLKEHDLTELEVARDYGENDNLNVRVARQKTSLPQQHITIPQQTIDSSDVTIVEQKENKIPTDPKK
jgi:acetyl-CoA carboxylase biotin carboxyl carrier protein